MTDFSTIADDLRHLADELGAKYDADEPLEELKLVAWRIVRRLETAQLVNLKWEKHYRGCK